MDKSDQPQSSSATPARLGDVGLFVELGGQGPTEIERLRQGAGALTQQIQTAIDHWREELRIDLDTEVVPVVMLYRRNLPKWRRKVARDAPRLDDGCE
jgi:hypothetical protein